MKGMRSHKHKSSLFSLAVERIYRYIAFQTGDRRQNKQTLCGEVARASVFQGRGRQGRFFGFGDEESLEGNRIYRDSALDRTMPVNRT
jgi:hypothetical protein